MSRANSITRLTDLDFLEIRENLKTFLRSQSEFADFDFEGSGMAVLLDILVYNTHYNAYYLNMVGSEMFLDSAQLRNNILSRAKELNYLPGSKTGATARVTITVTPGPFEDNTAQVLTLDKYTTFLSESKDGTNYQFLTLDSYTTSKTANNNFVFSNVTLKQGEVITNQYLVNHGVNTKRLYSIPSANCDTSTIAVVVQESSSNTVTTQFTRAEDLTEVTTTSPVYFLQESSDSNNTYQIQFGDGYIGKSLSNGNIVIITYLVNEGENANKVNRFVISDTVGVYSANVQIATTMEASGGAEKETIEQIRYRAPIHYTVQNRAVTKNDYEALILRDYPNIRSVSIWGGDEAESPVYGKIFISLAPVDNYEISLVEKEAIKEEIIQNRSVLTVFPEFIDPDYTYLQIEIEAAYNPSLTPLEADELKALVRAVVLDYKATDLDTFDSVYRESRLHTLIDQADPSITSTSIKTYLQKRIRPSLNIPLNYTLKYYQQLFKGSILDKLSSYPAATVKDLNGVARQVFFEEVPEAFTGIDYVEVTNAGEDYNENPTVTITGDGVGATATARVVNGKIVSIDVTNRGSNYTRATVAITGGGEGAGATATAILQVRNGIIRTYYFKANGEKVIVNDAAGTIDYEKGIITLTNFETSGLAVNPLYLNDTLTFSIQPEKQTLHPVRNQILTLDENDSSAIKITMVTET